MKLLLALVCVLPFIAAHKNFLYDASSDYKKCHAVNGGWGEWSSFSPCTKTCGSGGLQKRYRYCDSPVPKYGGKKCVGDNYEVKPCEGYVECPVNGGWGSWKKGKCSKRCGSGILVYKRYCNNPAPKHCGQQCHGPSIKKEKCNTHKCPIDGEWEPWQCGNCFTLKKSDTCVKKCTRNCKPPKYGGADCSGKSKVLKYCDESKCRKFHPKHGPCYHCLLKAEKYADKLGDYNFVGHACRADKSYCKELRGGIENMYKANNWFFLHCSNDGPWCKPCATRNLVYNPKCGQCEKTRNGECTGPLKSQHKHTYKDDDELDAIVNDFDDIDDLDLQELDDNE